MFLLGVITNKKNKSYLKKELSSIIPTKNIIFITDKNILNIKNIKFEMIIIDDKINNKKEFRKIISEAKIVILNTDIQINYEILNDLNLTIITYGFNSKSTFSISSIDDNNMIICLQRNIYSNKGIEIEPEEYQIKIRENTEKYITIAIFIIKKIYD